MTGNSNAASGGSNLAVAWIHCDANNALDVPIAFTEGMTWGEWFNSDYHLLIGVSAASANISVGVVRSTDMMFALMNRQYTIYDGSAAMDNEDVLKPGYTYTAR